MSRWLTTSEAASIAHACESTIRRACQDWRLVASKPFGRWLIDPAELDKYIRGAG